MNKSSFSVQPYDDSMRIAWDRVITESKNGNFLHRRDYMDYHAHRFDERSVIVLRKQKPVACFPCNRDGLVLVSHSGLTYGGLIYGTCLHAIDVLHIFDRLIALYRSQGIERIRYKAIPHIFHRSPAEEDLYALQKYGAKLARRDLNSVVPLTKGTSFSKLRRRCIRKACNSGIRLLEGCSTELFYSILEQNLKERHSVSPVHSLHELKLLQSRLGNRIRLFCAVQAESSHVLAGSLLYDFGHVVHCQYSATTENGRSLCALDYLYSHLLEGAFPKAHYFSFGISTENCGKHLNTGLLSFKEGFGARAVVHDHYDLEL